MSGSDVVAVRRAIDAEVRGRTLCDLYARNAEQHGALPALRWEERGAWRGLSWAEYREAVADVALGLRELGVERGDVVALMLPNRPEHLIADGGVLHAAATPVSVYTTLAPEQIAHLASDCSAKVAILEGGDDLRRWDEVRSGLPDLEHVVLVEDHEGGVDRDDVLSWDELRLRGRSARLASPERLEAAVAQVEPDDPATLIYTSGTTGPPKGVILTHRNVLWELASVERFLPLPAHLRTISYLPLAHIAERMFSHYLHLDKAGTVSCCPDPTRAIDVVQAARPQAFLGVPRVWEKIRTRLETTVEDEPNERKRALARAAFHAGREAVRFEQQGLAVPRGLRLRRRLFDRLVYRKVRARLGLDACALAVSGAAPLADDVVELFSGLGLPVHEAYGLTETTAVTNANRPGGLKIGTVGQALPGVELRLAADGEICARGGNIMAGYHGDEEATSEVVDEDGWLHTGDLGSLDDQGYLTIVGRRKDLIVTAGGKNVAPAAIEALVKQHPLVGQVCVIGDRRPFVAAVVVLEPDAAREWAAREGLVAGDTASLAAEPRVRAEVQRAVDAANERVARAEQIRRFTLLPHEWTAESEELTPTLKLRRDVIEREYADEIEALYAG